MIIKIECFLVIYRVTQMFLRQRVYIQIKLQYEAFNS